MKIFLIILSTFLIMEFIAWSLHKFVMHGFLWVLHYDHHNKSQGFFEKNDAFFLFFAIPSSIMIALGTLFNYLEIYSIGYGILAYGIAYFLIHEVLIHKRFKKIRKLLFGDVNNKYLKVLMYAHKMHHKHIGKEDGESFGMLFVHPKYYKEINERIK